MPAPAVYRWVDGNGVARLVTNDCAAAGVSCTEGVTPTIPGMPSYYIIGDFDAVVRRRVCVGTWLVLGCAHTMFGCCCSLIREMPMCVFSRTVSVDVAWGRAMYFCQGFKS